MRKPTSVTRPASLDSTRSSARLKAISQKPTTDTEPTHAPSVTDSTPTEGVDMSEHGQVNNARASAQRKRPRVEGTSEVDGPSQKARRTGKKVPRRKPMNATDGDAVDSNEHCERAGKGETPATSSPDTAGRTTRKKRASRRAGTPESAAHAKVATNIVKMSDLTRSSRNGQKSKRETAMQQIDWSEVVRRRRALTATNVTADIAAPAETPQDTSTDRGPVLRMINGQIVVDQGSLVVDRHAEATADTDVLEEVEEDDLTTRVTTQSWLPPSRRGRGDKWTPDETDSFYAALRMFGTDFFIISQMFPKKSRRQIKMKFIREERADPERVREALIVMGVGDERMDFEAYKTASGRTDAEFRDPRIVEEELRVVEEKEKENIEKAKRDAVERSKQKAAAEQTSQANAGRPTDLAKKKSKESKGKKGGGPSNAGEDIEILETFDD